MTTDDSLFREVDQDLQEDKELTTLKKNLPFVIAAAVLLVIFVAGRQIWDANRTAAAERNSSAFSEAVELAESDAAEARTRLEELSADMPDGYAALSLLQAASLADGLDDRDGAIDNLLAVTRLGVPDRMKTLARIRASYLALPDGQARVMEILDGAENGEDPMTGFAREAAGLAALNAGDYGTANSYFESIQTMTGLPSQLVTRAGEFAALAQLGSSGIKLEAKQESAADLLGEFVSEGLSTDEEEPLQLDQDDAETATSGE